MAVADAVLDASAVLAFLTSEPGSDIVQKAMTRSLISAVNVAEIVAKLIDRGVPPGTASTLVASLPFEIVSLDAALGFRVGTLRDATRTIGLSLGDRACLALAEREGLPALTADREWSRLNLQIPVHVIR